MTSAATQTDNRADAIPEPLPEFLPVTPRKPVVHPWWIPWPVAILLAPLLWLMPRRMGPHFATVRWPGAILGNLVYVIYGISCLVLARVSPRYGWVAYLLGEAPGQAPDSPLPGPTLSQIIRSPLAAALNAWEAGSGGELLAQILIGISAYAGVVVFFSLLLMPPAAAGEKKRYLFARCVKLVLWSMTSMLLFGLAATGTELYEVSQHWVIIPWALLLGWILYRAVGRYPGAAEGPAWPPRRPTCRKCGYLLTGMRLADRCPECGTSVVDSMQPRRKRRGWRRKATPT